MEWIISIILAYLLGSISFSYIVGKKLANIDIRQHGSGNAGATNTLRVLGKGPAALVFLLDVLKGVASVLTAKYLGDGSHAIMITSGLASIVGHNWPVFFHFKGGKGVATTIGVMATLVFKAAFFAGIFAILSIVITRYVSLGSLIFATLLSVFIYFLDYELIYLYVGLLITILAYIRHYKNIINLMKGKERRLGDSKRSL
ncbi:glycerol-3-phosphate 1-O-acyltransferase PlsY [Microaerobacter geothermalis]|uniref:glycerol-3-phosphate 1-O-acyltransferase PlsY n=1 Tax=Microaerobacter geothermalis TaxID=674972 RepID=UPI001F27F68A|nr:glycerol-3-phosphate 1-O-acyltransferase PlsY [Microaerobacter geothermalis]MCF6093528.1 glycerol-3-phosphate 1-O-acyltransferase PlsY [Microaerobacter geothermalis]